MNIDPLWKAFPNETVCREFFESVIWTDGRRCLHCGHRNSVDCMGPICEPGFIIVTAASDSLR